MSLISYVKTLWTNGVTPRNATNFNHMEDGIKSACDGVDELNNNLTTVKDNIAIITKSATDTIESLYSQVGPGKKQTFTYYDRLVPSDYPSAMTDLTADFNPVVTVYRVVGIMHIAIISVTNNGTPKCINGYYNGNFYWGSPY